MNTENQGKVNRWNRTIRLIVEQTDEMIDFSDFIDEVVNFKETKEREVNKGPSETKLNFKGNS